LRSTVHIVLLHTPRPPSPTPFLFPYTPLFRSVPITLAITIHCVVSIISIHSVPCLFRSCWFDIVIVRLSFLFVTLSSYKCECERCYDSKEFSFLKPFLLLYNFIFIMGLSFVIVRSSFLIVSLTAYKCECESCYDSKDFSFHKPFFLLYNFNFIMGLSLFIILIFMITL